MGSKKTLWTIIIIVVLVILGVYLMSLTKKQAPKGVSGPVNVNSVTNNKTTSNASTETSEAIPKVPGSSLVKKGKVVTKEGKEVKNDVLPGSSESPRESHALSENEIPKEAIKLVVTKADGFKPNDFTVKAGSAVTITLTSGDGHTHVLKFKDPSLRGIELTVIKGQTRATSFNAPQKGDYQFFCNVPGHTATGVMHVK